VDASFAGDSAVSRSFLDPVFTLVVVSKGGWGAGRQGGRYESVGMGTGILHCRM
jgi:hypothetical protein